MILEDEEIIAEVVLTEMILAELTVLGTEAALDGGCTD